MNGINKSPLWHGSGFWVVISRCILEIQPHGCCCDFLLLAFVPFMPFSVESRLSFVQKTFCIWSLSFFLHSLSVRLFSPISPVSLLHSLCTGPVLLHVFSLCFCLCSQCFIGLYNISLLYETVFGFAPACVLVLCCLPVCSLHPNTFVLLQYWLIIWLSQANKALKISSTAILVFHAIAYMVKFNQYIMISFYYQFVKEGNCIFYVAKHKNNLNAAQYVLSLQMDCQWQCGEWRYFWWSYSRNVLQRRGLNDGEGFKATHLQGLEEVNQMFWGSLFICAGAMYALGMVMSFQTTHGCVSTTYFFTAGIPHTFV